MVGLDTYILSIDRNIGKDDFARLLSCISEEKRERICRFNHQEGAQRALLGDVLARYAICKRLGVKNSNLIFGTNDYGKPILREPNGIHFNISHSGNWVVCAVDDTAVGIDVEIIKPIDHRVAERFFSEDEYISLINQPEETRLKYFYMIWTLKESYIKMEGKGLSIPLNSFTVRIKSNGISVYIENKNQKLHFYQSFLDSDTVLAVCSPSSKINETIFVNIGSFLAHLPLIESTHLY